MIKNAIRLFSSNRDFIIDNKTTNNNISINKLLNNSNISNLSQNNNLVNKEKNISFKENKNMNNSIEYNTNDIIFPNIVSNSATLYRLKKSLNFV